MSIKPTKPSFLRNSPGSGSNQLTPSLVFKIMKGDTLSNAEISTLQNILKKDDLVPTPAEIKDLVDYLTIQGRDNSLNLDSSVDLQCDIAPFSNQAGHGRSLLNLSREITLFDERMKKVFGHSYAGQANLQAIKQLITERESSCQNQQVDGFVSAVHSELEDSNNKTFLDNIDREALTILALTCPKKPESVTSADKNETLEQSINNRSFCDSIDCDEWLKGLDNFTKHISDEFRNPADFLKNKILNLETLDISKDRDTILEYLDIKSNLNDPESQLEEFVQQFNSMILNTRSKHPSLITNPEIKTARIAQEADINSVVKQEHSEDDIKLLIEAQRMLNNSDYKADNPGIQKAEILFSDVLKNNSGLSAKEKQLLLKNLVNKLFEQSQYNQSISDSAHISKKEEQEVLNKFKQNMNFLYDFINQFEEDSSERQVLVRDIIAYLKGQGPLSTELQKALSNGEFKKLRESLDYMKKGYGDPRHNAAIFEILADTNEDRIDLIHIINSSNSFSEIAERFQSSVLTARLYDVGYMPSALLNDSRISKSNFLGPLSNFLLPEPQKDAQGNPLPNQNALPAVLQELGINTETDLAELLSSKPVSSTNVSEALGNPEHKLHKLISILDCLITAEGSTTKEDEIAKFLNNYIKDNKFKDLPDLAERIRLMIINLDDEHADIKKADGSRLSSYGDVRERRKKLEDISKKFELEIFSEVEINQSLSVSDYREMFINFAMTSDELDKLVRSDKSIYKNPESSSLDYNYNIDSSDWDSLAQTQPYEIPEEKLADYNPTSEFVSGRLDLATFLSRLDTNPYVNLQEILGLDEDTNEDDVLAINWGDNLSNGHINPKNNPLKYNYPYYYHGIDYSA
jgi:hypothetical protein